ncbi:MAG: DNA mismatch repair endonuclease MutL [Clostridiaceae bacterium]|nr:DNA mismatch repair endonuclease MutL [Clostridiaceae bacterium]
MGNIIILDENTANKIAAGEVVERPASVIKELVENSIDAGANNISVEIRNGGISFIRITDNGCGISEDDAELAFERHATSKIRRADDLESITSMGFRGEALASIAAVSSVTLMTRVKDSVQGISVTVKGGCITDLSPAGCPVGTSITVKELFFNTPARYKFLKKDTTEAGYIIDILSRIALSHPEISFTLVNTGSRVLHTPGNGDLKSTVFSVYGAETARHLLEVDYRDEQFRIKGFVGKAEIARSNRNHQSIYINKRYIRNKTITSAIDTAFSTFIMKGRYPFVLLDIEVNPSNVDVNVHPSKMEVKFSNDQEVFRAVYHAVNNALLSQSSVRTLPDTAKSGDSFRFTGSSGAHASDKRHERKEGPSYSQQEFEWVRNELHKKREAAISGNSVNAARDMVRNESDRGADNVLLQKESDADGARTNVYSVEDESRNDPVVAEPSPKADISDTENEAREADSSAAGREIFKNTRIIGQAFSTYILLEGEDELYLLDQHAAHERIRYEELKKSFEKDQPFTQMLLSVIHVDLTSSEYQFALSESELFERLGFSFESFGTNSIILRSAPFIDDGADIRKGFLDILNFVMSGSSGDKRAITDEALFRMACRSSVMAHKKLDPREIEALLQSLSSLENPFTCPHGRPAVLKLRRYELEKLFKRIV